MLTDVLPKVTADMAAELDEAIAAESKQIKRKTAVALMRLKNEIKAAESELTRQKTGAERSDSSFAKSQQLHLSANHLNHLKQNEFIEKMKLKNKRLTK